jgi:hypothetical protein
VVFTTDTFGEIVLGAHRVSEFLSFRSGLFHGVLRGAR